MQAYLCGVIVIHVEDGHEKLSVIKFPLLITNEFGA